MPIFLINLGGLMPLIGWPIACIDALIFWAILSAIFERFKPAIGSAKQTILSKIKRHPKMNRQVLIFLFLISQNALADPVLSCHDGDTCRVKRDNGSITKVRLAGIDAPELKQPSGKSAQRFLETLVVGKQVQLACAGKSYKRSVCSVTVDGKDVEREMVANGWAIDYKQYSKGQYASAQKQAREQRLGVWANPNFKSPFCERHKASKECKINLAFQP